MNPNLPEKPSSNEPPSVRIKLFWIEASGTGRLGIAAVVFLVIVLVGIRYLPT